MLQTLIKRNGSEEPLIPAKLNGWSEWAATHLKGRVDWSQAALAAVAKLPTKASTRELMLALIDELLAIRTWPAYLMAGRLAATIHRKDTFGSITPPTVYEQQKKLLALGLMREMKYSEEEYAKIETIIDHSLDFHYPEFALKQIREKYAIRNYTTGEIFETPQFVYMRMAMTLAEDVEPSRRVWFVRRFYTKFSRKKLSAPTPNYLYLGTPHAGYASCCIFTSADNSDSLAIGDHIAYKMTVNSAGLGSFISTRTVGDPIDKGRVKHAGRYKYYKANAAATGANMQAGRAGAGTTSFSAFDPEAVDIVQYRNPMQPADKQLRDIHYSMLSNAWFAKKVRDAEDIFTFTEFSAPDLFDAFFSPDIKEFVRLYKKYEADESFPKKYVSARKLLLHSFAEAFDTGTSYHTFIDEANRHTPFKISRDHRIHSSNLCVAPETKILTDKGYVEIQSVAGQKVNVWNGEEWSEVDVVKTGENQGLLHVETDSGWSLDCTPYHKFYVVDDYGHTHREVRARELKAGDKLIKFDFPVVQGDLELDRAYQHGFYCGDGCDTPQGQRIYLYGEKCGLQMYFPDVCDWYNHPQQARVYGHTSGLPEKYWVPLHDYSVKSRLAWLAGYLDADGTVASNGENQSLHAKSTNYSFLRDIQLMLSTLGVSAKVKFSEAERITELPANDGTGGKKEYHCAAVWRLLINSNDTQKLVQLGLETRRLDIFDHDPQRNARQFVKVVGVSDFGRVDDTYCFTEPKLHMGVFNGILTGQCQEIMEIQAPYYDMRDLYSETDHGRGEIAMCNLAAVPVDNIGDDEDYFDTCYMALKMIDHTILNCNYPFPHLAFTAKQRMNAGVGIMGLATYMARKGLKWTSVEGKQELHRVYERHMYFLIKASIAISKERGLAPWIHKTKWPEGWTPLETYNRNVDKIAPFTNVYDWAALSEEIKANGGIAHSVLCAMMPGESSSKALGSTNANYPIRSTVMVKTDGFNTIRWAAVDGDILGDAYQSAWDIPTKDMIECYAIGQKWSDQGMSADLYRKFAPGETSVSEEEIVQTYLLMQGYGMKSRYYTNSLRPKAKALDKAESLVSKDVPTAPVGVNVLATPHVDNPAVAAGMAEVQAIREAAVHDGHSKIDAPAPVLDHALIGSKLGDAVVPDGVDASVEYVESGDGSKNCAGFCTL